MTVAIVTDSMTSLPAGVRDRQDVRMVPLTFHFGPESFVDKVDLSNKDFYEKLKSSEVFPKTSQPSAGAFAETYEGLAAYDDILVLTTSKKISGTYESAVAAAGMVDRPIELRDMKSAEMGSGLILLETLEVLDGGGDFKDVLQAAEAAIERCKAFFAVSTLEYLQKGGRIGRAQRLLGTALDIRPVLTLEDGEIVPHKRVRGRRRQIAALAEQLRPAVEAGRPVSLGHVDAPDAVAELAEISGGHERFIAEIGGVIGSHVGPGAYGLAYL